MSARAIATAFAGHQHDEIFGVGFAATNAVINACQSAAEAAYSGRGTLVGVNLGVSMIKRDGGEAKIE